MSSRIPIHQGSGFVLAQTGGAESVTLTTQQLPAHRHVHNASSSIASSTGTPAGFVADTSTTLLYGGDAPSAPLAPGFVATAGGSQPHANMAPFLGLNYIISLFGIFPTPT
jgi:microcystin-dependent protein